MSLMVLSRMHQEWRLEDQVGDSSPEMRTRIFLGQQHYGMEGACGIIIVSIIQVLVLFQALC